MITKNYKGLFVTDLDGTLLTDDRMVKKRDLRALAGLQAQGIATVIATGRSDYSFFRLIKTLGDLGHELLRSVDYIVFSTGAGIYCVSRKKLMKSYSLAEEDVFFICSCLESLEMDYMVHKPFPDTVNFSYRLFNRENDDFSRRIALYERFATPFDTDDGWFSWKGGATEVLCIIPSHVGAPVAARISEKLGRFSVIRATSPLDHRSLWMEIFSPSVSKSYATDFIARKIGVKRQHVCAVGNDYNDQDLLLWAGSGYVVDNGPASLKSKCINVASNNHSGVSAAAVHWMENLSIEE